MRRLIFILFLIAPLTAQAQYTLSGYVYDSVDREALPGATIQILDDSGQTRGTTSNTFGFYSLTVDETVVTLRISFIGYTSVEQRVDLQSTSRLDFLLDIQVFEQEGVEVVADRVDIKEEVLSTRMSTSRLTPTEISTIPTIGGEADLIKVARLLPGVTPGNEGGTGMFVRGGTDDQNLILLDDAVVYNIGHLFGFFSVFNTDAVKDVEVIKGAFPTRHGGRLSSVVDVRMDEGSTDHIKAKGGIGILASRLTVDGPLFNKRASFMVAGRRTYIDQIFRIVGEELPYYFYDLNGKINYKLSDNDRIYFSTYLGSDILSLSETADADSTSSDDDLEGDLDFGFDLGNFTTTLRWNHIYPGSRLFSNVTLHQTSFSYDISGSFLDNELLIRSRIQDFGIKGDWDFYLSPENTISFGIQSVFHSFRPNIVQTSGEINDVLASRSGVRLNESEWAVYGGNDVSLGSRLRVNWGLRLTAAQTGNKFYAGPEPRISARYSLTDDLSIKASYSRMRQYMHRVSSSSIALPTDLWYPVTENIKPQDSHQVSTGITMALPKIGSTLSVEGYLKNMSRILEYKEGASLILNDEFEDELISGSGRSRGVELLLRRRTGDWTGWVGYSLARTTRLFDGLNNGNRYSAKFDRRHTFTGVSMLKITNKLTFSTVWTFMSGAWFTAQNGQFLMPNGSLTGIDLVPVYTDRNAVPLASSHRLDINFVIKSPHKRFDGEWHIGAYNFYNRAAPFRVAITSNGESFQYVQQGLFGFIPSIAYNFKIK